MLGGDDATFEAETLKDVKQFGSKAAPLPKKKEAAPPSANTLNIVLQQEVERFNKLLRVIHNSLRDLENAVSGLVVMSQSLEKMYQSFLIAQVPSLWSDAAYPSLKPLGSWVTDLIARVTFLKRWIANGAPTSFLLPGFFFPQGFLTGVLQMHSRLTHIPIDTLEFRCHVADTVQTLRQARAEAGQDKPATTFAERRAQAEEEASGILDLPVESPPTGVYINGLFLEGARWDWDTHILTDSNRGELFTRMPTIWLEPVVKGTKPVAFELNELNQNDPDSEMLDVYHCPVYKTTARYGVLSTTGHSTNFIFALDLPTLEQNEKWIRAGVAMLCALSD